MREPLLNVLKGRSSEFLVGAFLLYTGLRHIFYASTSSTAELGIPEIIAVLAGLFLVPFGAARILYSIKPEIFNPDYTPPNYPENQSP